MTKQPESSSIVIVPRLGNHGLIVATLVFLLVLSISRPFLVMTSAQSSTPVSPVLTGLNFPVSLKFAPDGVIFFTEKNTGEIRIILQNGTLLPTPFATISPIFTDGESGLLGVALDPSFTSNGYVYAYYTYRDTSSYTHGHIVRYTATSNTGTSPLAIFDVVSSGPGTIYHNGGYIKFGADGKLYAQVGEFHQDSQAQNQSATDGKMLRMNPDGSVPSDNPTSGSLVWASGIRNAFGFDFDNSNGRLISTMAGPSSDDKILIIVKGGNYGWPTCLGYCNDPRFIDPIVDFAKIVTPTGIATVAPNLYYFGEWNTGNLMRLQLTPQGTVVNMTQAYSQPGGIIAVELNPNGLVYFSTPDAIYTFNPQTPLPPPCNCPLLSILPFAAIGAAAAALFYITIRYRNKRGRTIAN